MLTEIIQINFQASQMGLGSAYLCGVCVFIACT